MAPRLALTAHAQEVDVSARYDVAVVTGDVGIQDVTLHKVGHRAQIEVVQMLTSGSRRCACAKIKIHFMHFKQNPG